MEEEIFEPEKAITETLDSIYEDFKVKAGIEFSTNRKIAPVAITHLVVDIIRQVRVYGTEYPKYDDVEYVLKLISNVRFLKWLLKRYTHERRTILLNSPISRMEAYIETRVHNLLLKKRKYVSVNGLAIELEKRFGASPDATKKTIRRIIHRVRVRNQRFKAEENWKQILEEYEIPPHIFLELVAAGILTPRTMDESLRVVGKTIQFYLGKGRLKLV